MECGNSRTIHHGFQGDSNVGSEEIAKIAWIPASKLPGWSDPAEVPRWTGHGKPAEKWKNLGNNMEQSSENQSV